MPRRTMPTYWSLKAPTLINKKTTPKGNPMRQKVEDYLAKPNKKAYAGLTSMEQKFVDATKENGKADDKKPSPKAK